MVTVGSRLRSMGVPLLLGFLFTVHGALASAASLSGQAVPQPSLGAGEFRSVSCPPGGCIAIGNAFEGSGDEATRGEAFAGNLVQNSWALLPLPFGGGQNPELAGVSCPSESFCVAAGATQGPEAQTNSTAAPLVATWDGSQWSTQLPPAPSGSERGELDGVSCTSPTFCVAVGAVQSRGREHALIETWSGAAWHAREAPAVRGTTSSGLSGVSCLSASDCVAVGDYFVGGRASEGLGYALILHWNGSSWALRRIGEYSGDRYGWQVGLQGVSCATAGSCLAVGTANPQGNGDSAQIAVAISPRTLSFTRAGLPALPTLPPYSPEGFFNAVSCESARDCAAVGALYFDRGHSHGEAFAATRNGHRWTRQSIAGADAATLTGVSCSSSGCVSVGYRGEAATTRAAIAYGTG